MNQLLTNIVFSCMGGHVMVYYPVRAISVFEITGALIWCWTNTIIKISKL